MRSCYKSNMNNSLPRNRRVLSLLAGAAATAIAAMPITLPVEAAQTMSTPTPTDTNNESEVITSHPNGVASVETTSRPTFNVDTALWYDGLIAYAKANPAVVEPILVAVKMTPNQRNLPRLIDAVKALPDDASGPMWATLLTQANNVRNLSYRGEFRFQFSKSQQQSSAASEFYSMIRQALTYNA